MSTAFDNERDLLAAEYALGVLEAAEREEARRLVATDAAFARLVEAWDEHLSPFLDEVAPVEPPAALWERINGVLDEDGARLGNVHQLQRRVTLWRGYSAAISAIAAALLLVVAFDPFDRNAAPQPPQGSAPVTTPSPPTLVANVVAEDRSAAFVVSYDPTGRSLLVSPAVASPAPGHDHELWLIPASGKPLSLGLVAGLTPHRLPVAKDLLPHFNRNSTVAISVEPVGGSSTGQPTGPVVASGKLAEV